MPGGKSNGMNLGEKINSMDWLWGVIMDKQYGRFKWEPENIERETGL